ncbi:protein kinase-like protein [Artemisia annua]|uniref:Protein kinase-like protein n=1 Tax=Artemisia annua TaxID=35608 RepID=A0A2U1QH27_ARTAN|nr:protein kinase-like protein [Artemisia annua]
MKNDHFDYKRMIDDIRKANGFNTLADIICFDYLIILFKSKQWQAAPIIDMHNNRTKHVVSVRLGYQVILHRATVPVPKIQAVYGVVGILKCLAGRVTTATWDQTALIFIVPRQKLGDETQETLRTSQFPNTHVKISSNHSDVTRSASNIFLGNGELPADLRNFSPSLKVFKFADPKRAKLQPGFSLGSGSFRKGVLRLDQPGNVCSFKAWCWNCCCC